MTPHQQVDSGPVPSRSLDLNATLYPSALIRTHRIVREGENRANESRFTDTPGIDRLTLHYPWTAASNDPARQWLLIPIDPGRWAPGRLDAELGWVRERLSPSIALALVGRGPEHIRSSRLALAKTITRLIDVTGEVSRLVRSAGDAIGLLVDPATKSIEIVSPDHAVFTVERLADGTDRTLAVGDLRY